ncbi:ABC transporter permease [Halostagnicola bangensis]
MEIGVVLGVIVIGFVHGVLPDHGWPIAATYALNKQRRLFYGFVAALILGVGHLVSSVLLVLAYFWFSTFAAFAEGPWMRYVAGTLLILLGVHEYRHGGHAMDEHDHEGHDHHDGEQTDERGDDRHDSDHTHEHGNSGHSHHTDGGDETHHTGDRSQHHHDARDEDDSETSVFSRVRRHLPGGGGHQHLEEEHAQRGLYALGMTALLLGFAHEEPIQILAICVGTERCLELMLLYSTAVIIAIVTPTLLLIAGYEHHQKRIERYTPYLPTITAIVLVAMGIAFITGLI